MKHHPTSTRGREPATGSICVEGCSVWIKLFRDRRSFRRHLRKFNSWKYFTEDIGNIRAYTHNDCNTTILATVLLNETDLDLNTVVHECFHVTAVYADYHNMAASIRMAWREEHHEELAEFHGNLVEAILKNLDSWGFRVYSGGDPK